ncbi:MAG: hypothetical protein WKG00_30290 [Polyangiaceae bacterium]
MQRCLVLAVLVSLLWVLIAPAPAGAVDRNFAGSAQYDYHLVPSQMKRQDDPSVFDGSTLELAFKLAVDVSDELSVNVKVCFGCHGFETDMAYIDYRVADELGFRVGRFSPSFGSFNLRHDPANHRTSDKPLPYDMGRMLRMRDWNMGVLPSPFPDNGVEITGTHWFGDLVQLDWSAHAVSGFKGADSGPDLDFVQSRDGSLYYVDNNGVPTVGGRLGATFRLGQRSDLGLGLSILHGPHDPEGELAYTIGGADVSLRLHRTQVRLEYLVRRQELDVSDPGIFKYQVPTEGGDFFMKHGAYVEVEQALSDVVDLIGRVDGLYRVGNLPASAPLLARSAVIRYTVGSAITIQRGLRLKTSAELWSFSDRGAVDRHNEVTFHAGAVATF